MLGMCAAGTPPMPDRFSLRRAHSPAAISASASKAPRTMRMPGPNQPCSIE
jgi:hypothetical protein